MANYSTDCSECRVELHTKVAVSYTIIISPVSCITANSGPVSMAQQASRSTQFVTRGDWSPHSREVAEMLSHEDNILNKFRILKESHIRTNVVGLITHPTIVPRPVFELTQSTASRSGPHAGPHAGHCCSISAASLRASSSRPLAPS